MRTQSKFRLLVVRLGAMGDILHALPAVTALRQTHPAWHIDWVVEPVWTALLSARNDRPGTGADADTAEGPGPDQPLIDRLIPARTKAWGRKPLSLQTFREIGALRRTLRAGAYDAVIDFQGAVRSALIGQSTRARRHIGESAPREWAARWLFTERVMTSGAHVIEQDMELAAAIAGDDLAPTRPLLPTDAAAERWCAELLGSTTQPLVLITPGAGWGAKRWPVERYGTVAAQLAARGMRVLVNSGPGEETLAQGVAAQAPAAAEIVGCTLAQLIALTRRATLVLGGDTGPLHLACALGRPVVGIYGPTDPARNGPYGTRFKVLRSPFSQRNHARNHAPEAGLLTITPEEVLQAIDEVLAPEEVS